MKSFSIPFSPLLGERVEVQEDGERERKLKEMPLADLEKQHVAGACSYGTQYLFGERERESQFSDPTFDTARAPLCRTKFSMVHQ